MKPSFRYKCRVLKVLDGDSADTEISLGFNVYTKQRLRFLGVDCPETRTKDLEEKKAGLKAKKWVKSMIEGKEVIIESEKAGKFGRFLARVYIGDMCINDELIKRGLASEYWGGAR
ncbi:unnamed protein product [marine sediment metagenome]|uniref:TNase-like domain-containing protein n=1 Tax=marine sediment metagenome TaxID=412755 RepID=X0Y7H2_9ZZZZ